MKELRNQGIWSGKLRPDNLIIFLNKDRKLEEKEDKNLLVC